MAGTISALRFQKRNRDRVNVYLDGTYAFALPAVAAARLSRGQFLSDEEIADLKALDEAEEAHERCLRFLAYRPRSTGEVRRYLEQRKVAGSIIDHVLDRLQGAGYLDDRDFARFWVSDRERFNPRGPVALRHELRQKGVSDHIIEEALQAVVSKDSAYRAALSRARRLTGLDERAFRQKLGGFLLRRGFGHDVVWPVVDQVWQEQLSNPEEG